MPVTKGLMYKDGYQSYNLEQNFCNKVKKSSKIEHKQKFLITSSA